MTKLAPISKLFILSLFAAGTLSLSACKTVSEDTCMAGNWEAVGFKDGTNGKSAERLSKIAESCHKYGVSVDNLSYMTGYEAGLPKYCTFERGFERGESGSSYNEVCTGELAAEYGPGYEEGRVRYQIHSKHAQLVDRYEDITTDLYYVRENLRRDDLTDKERNRLRYRARRLENSMDSARYDIRQFERKYGLSRASIGRF